MIEYIKNAINIVLLRQSMKKILNEIEIKKEFLIYIGLTILSTIINFATSYFGKTPVGNMELIVLISTNILAAIFGIAYYLFSILELHFFSKILGGKGTLKETFAALLKITNVVSLALFLPIQLIILIAILLAYFTQTTQIITPITDLVMLLVVLMALLASAIIAVKLTKILYKLNTLKAITAAIILPLILEIVLIIVIAVIFAVIWIKIQEF